MGLLDDAKKLGTKAKGLVSKHEDKVKGGVEKAAGLIDKTTGGKHTAKIDDLAQKAKGSIDKLAD